jgi:hypothetical protein
MLAERPTRSPGRTSARSEMTADARESSGAREAVSQAQRWSAGREDVGSAARLHERGAWSDADAARRRRDALRTEVLDARARMSAWGSTHPEALRDHSGPGAPAAGASCQPGGLAMSTPRARRLEEAQAASESAIAAAAARVPRTPSLPPHRERMSPGDLAMVMSVLCDLKVSGPAGEACGRYGVAAALVCQWGKEWDATGPTEEVFRVSRRLPRSWTSEPEGEFAARHAQERNGTGALRRGRLPQRPLQSEGSP